MSTAISVPATSEDLEEIAAVDAETLRSRSGLVGYADELERDFASIRVVRVGGRIVAFIDYWIIGDEAHLLAIATRPGHTRRGYARTLIIELAELARSRACTAITLEVRTSNVPAIGLYESLGFRTVGRRVKYYAEGDEDALVMLLELDQ